MPKLFRSHQKRSIFPHHIVLLHPVFLGRFFQQKKSLSRTLHAEREEKYTIALLISIETDTQYTIPQDIKNIN